MIARVLVKMGAMVRAQGMIYKAVDWLVLLYVSDSWVMTGAMLKVLEGFHHRAARRITGTKATRFSSGEWDYHPVVAEMESAGLHTINGVHKRRNTTPFMNSELR